VPCHCDTLAVRDFRKLMVWQKADSLAVDAHRILERSRGRGTAAHRNQLSRAIASIPANIAEGCGKRSDIEFARYVDIALGSAKESENHFIFARDMGWLDPTTFALLDARLTEVRRMLFSLGKVMRQRAEGATRREGGEPGAGRLERWAVRGEWHTTHPSCLTAPCCRLQALLLSAERG
jgi:four helix bundle protein